MTAIDHVSHHTTFTLLDENNQAVPVELAWYSDDPVAAYLRITQRKRVRKKVIEWVISVDLLTAGLLTPAGLGDVQVSPLSTDLIGITLDSPSGHAVFHADRDVISDFLAEVAEHEPVDIELALDCWLLGVLT